MNPRLPRDLSARDVLRAFLRAGFKVVRQTGSHVQLLRGSTKLSLPYHKKLGTGLLRGLIKDAGLSIEEFLRLLG